MSEGLDKFMENLYSDRVKARAASIPDKISFVDENDEPMEDWGEVELTHEMKLMLAEQSIKWHQSLETTFIRILMVHANRVIRVHDKENK